ncbi:hypothetical protein pipiens_019391, partial [Culex pipiens pipiens]
MIPSTTSRSCYKQDLYRYLYRSGLTSECIGTERPEQTPGGPHRHQLLEENIDSGAMGDTKPKATNRSSSGRLARLRQQKLAVQEALLKKRQELTDLQARIEQDYEEDRRKFEMEWEMRYNNLRLRDEGVAGNNIKAGEEQGEEKKDELLDRVRRYEVGSTMAELAETTNVVLEKLFVTESGSGARVVDMESPAGTSGSVCALASFSRECESEELSLEVHLEETAVPTRSGSSLNPASATNALTAEIPTSPNGISGNSFANDLVYQDASLQKPKDSCCPEQAESCILLDGHDEDVDEFRLKSGRLKLKEEELVGQGKGTLLQRTSSGQQAVDQKRQLPQKPRCQPLQSNALQDSGEDSLPTTEKGSRQLLSCGTTVKEEINRFGQTQIDSAFVDTSRRCGYSGAAKKVVWSKANKKKLIVRTDERERSLLLKERWLMMGRKPASLTTKTRRSNPWRGTVGWRYTDGWRKIGPVAGRGSTVWDWYEKVPHRRCKRKYEYVPKLDQQQLGLRMLEEEEAALDPELVAKGARKNNSSATIYAFCVDTSPQMTENERFPRSWTLQLALGERPSRIQICKGQDNHLLHELLKHLPEEVDSASESVERIPKKETIDGRDKAMQLAVRRARFGSRRVSLDRKFRTILTGRGMLRRRARLKYSARTPLVRT